MMRFRPTWLLLPLLLAACGDEQPLDVGSELLPSQALRSFEITLDPAQYLLRDTAFALYGDAVDADYIVLAHDFEGVLNATAFARFQVPTVIGVTDTLGVARSDSAPRLIRGELVLYPDTTAVHTDSGSYRVAVYPIAESWNPAVADWEFRDTDTRWSVPGGTPGALVDTALVSPDSIILQVDSLTLRQWADTTNEKRGALLSLLNGPARLRTQMPTLRVYAKTRFKPDTTYMVVAQAPTARFDYRPRLAKVSSSPRVSGLPAWRTFVQVRPDLGNLTIPCGSGCTVPLREVSITRAELVLQPVQPPAGFTPEVALQPAAYRALAAPEFPLERSPIGAAIGTVEGAVAPARFVDGGAPAYLIVTEFVQQAVADSTSSGSTAAARSNWLVILPVGASSLGIGTFAPAPRLRLLVSIAREIQLP